MAPSQERYRSTRLAEAALTPVFIVTLKNPPAPPAIESMGGFTTQVALIGAPEQARLRLPAEAPLGVTLN